VGGDHKPEAQHLLYYLRGEQYEEEEEEESSDESSADEVSLCLRVESERFLCVSLRTVCATSPALSAHSTRLRALLFCAHSPPCRNKNNSNRNKTRARRDVSV
jgi:hypothetical protein